MTDCEYDEEADVLYITFGEPKKAVCDEVAVGVLVRRSGETGKIVGITIIDYKKLVDDSCPKEEARLSRIRG